MHTVLLTFHSTFCLTKNTGIVYCRTTLVIYNDDCQCKRRGRGRDERKDKQYTRKDVKWMEAEERKVRFRTAGASTREVEYRATFALKYNRGENCVCMLKDSLASAFSYLQWLCVELRLYEGGRGWKEGRGEDMISLKVWEKLEEACVCVWQELPHLSLVEGRFSEMLSV